MIHGDLLGERTSLSPDRTALVDVADAPRDAEWRQLPGGLLAPGFLDVQVNGGGGVLFNEQPTAAGARALARAHRRFGTTGLLPTLVSDRPDVVSSGIQAVGSVMAESPGEGARVLGIHLEGPFLNLERAGVHDPRRIRPLGDEDLELLTALPGGRTVVTLAPECVPAGSIQRLTAAGVRVCAGHSAASYQEIQSALAEGLSGFTHLFNAMSPLGSREPGVVGAALADPDSYCGVIADGIHVHPATLRIALAAKPRGRMLLVTDAMPPVGADDRSFRLRGETIRVENGRCATADGRLAGSALDMAQAVRNSVSWLGLPLEEALRMASLYPAAFLGLDGEFGHIQPERCADLVWLDDQLNVQATWVDGVELAAAAACD